MKTSTRVDEENLIFRAAGTEFGENSGGPLRVLRRRFPPTRRATALALTGEN